MIKLEIFDPPMCCSTGICGSSSDQTMVVFASDLEWLKTKGVDVFRYGLSFEPSKFIDNSLVSNLLKKEGNACLPIILIGNNVMHKGNYPSREKLAEICKISYDDEEAPPVHREANCCCGVDCDCQSIKLPDSSLPERGGSCENSAAEENCISCQECKKNNILMSESFKITLFIILLFMLILLIAYKHCCRADAEKALGNSEKICIVNI